MNSPGPTGRSPLDQARAQAGRDDLDWMRGLEQREVVCWSQLGQDGCRNNLAYRFASCCGHCEVGGREGEMIGLVGDAKDVAVK